MSPYQYARRAGLCQLQRDFRAYLSEVPVVGFNSQRYDLNVMKGALLKGLINCEEKIGFTVKKIEAMTCLKTDRLKFVDVCNFIAPGYSYAAYLKAYGVELRKGFFPYE